MKPVLLAFNQDRSTRDLILPALEKTGQYLPSCIEMDRILDIPSFGTDHFQAAILDFQTLDHEELKIVAALPGHLRSTPTLLLADQIAVHSYRKVDKSNNIITLQKPFEPKVFLSLLEKITSQTQFKPQVCPRFITNEPVRMMVLKTGLLIPTRMRNYSSGGAFLEYRGISLNIGDEVQVNFLPPGLRARKDNFQLKARIVWMRQGDHPMSPVRGVGIQFVA